MLSYVLLQHSYLYLLHYIVVHTQKQIHRWFFWRKSAQDTGSFENGKFSSRKRNGTKAVMFIENTPKTSKNAARLAMWIFLKNTPVVFNWKNILLFMVHSRLHR